FFSSRRRHTRCLSDWSSDVCSSDLVGLLDTKYLVLEQADVHDLRDTTTTRELYVIDSKRLGVHANRERVLVRIGEIVSISALDEIGRASCRERGWDSGGGGSSKRRY